MLFSDTRLYFSASDNADCLLAADTAAYGQRVNCSVKPRVKPPKKCTAASQPNRDQSAEPWLQAATDEVTHFPVLTVPLSLSKAQLNTGKINSYIFQGKAAKAFLLSVSNMGCHPTDQLQPRDSQRVARLGCRQSHSHWGECFVSRELTANRIPRSSLLKLFPFTFCPCAYLSIRGNNLCTLFSIVLQFPLLGAFGFISSSSQVDVWNLNNPKSCRTPQHGSPPTQAQSGIPTPTCQLCSTENSRGQTGVTEQRARHPAIYNQIKMQ